MFDDAFQKLSDILAPHAQSMSTSMSAGLERILSRLDRISDAVESEEFVEVRKIVSRQLTADTVTELIQVKAGEDWELELLTALGPCTLTITESERFRLAKQFDIPDFQQGIGMIVRENSSLQIVSTGNETPVKISCQFKMSQTKPSKATQSAGMREPDVIPQGRGVDDPSRHGV